MLASTRFNSKTLQERNTYLETHGMKCIYGTPNRIKPSVPLDKLLFVVEMNNETNQIEGIGLIRNFVCDTRPIYSDYNYNRYIYSGQYRVTREQMERTDKDVVDILDLILFKGYTHIKRHSGITMIPPKLLVDERTRGVNLTERIREIFKMQRKKIKKKIKLIL